MVFSLNFGLLFAAAMLISSIGFKNYVWFISLGYGFSIAGEGLLMLFLYGDKLTLGTILCSRGLCSWRNGRCCLARSGDDSANRFQQTIHIDRLGQEVDSTVFYRLDSRVYIVLS